MSFIFLFLFSGCIIINAQHAKMQALKEFSAVTSDPIHMNLMVTTILDTSTRRSMRADLEQLYKDHDVQIHIPEKSSSYYEVKTKSNEFVIRESKTRSQFDTLVLASDEEAYGVSSNMFWRISPKNNLAVLNYDILKPFTTLEELFAQQHRKIPIHEPLLGIKLGFPCHPGEYRWEGNRFLLITTNAQIPLAEGKLSQVNNETLQLNYFRRLGATQERKYHTSVEYHVASQRELFPLTFEIENHHSKEQRKKRKRRYAITFANMNQKFDSQSFSPIPFIQANAQNLRVQIISNSIIRTVGYSNDIWYAYSKTTMPIKQNERNIVSSRLIGIVAVIVLPIIAVIGLYAAGRTK